MHLEVLEHLKTNLLCICMIFYDWYWLLPTTLVLDTSMTLKNVNPSTMNSIHTSKMKQLNVEMHDANTSR